MNEADLPDTAEDEARPWEAKPRLRRDAEPHRGGLLYGLGAAAVLLGLAGLPFLFPLLLAFPLAVATSVLADRDLDLMRAGRMDPRGEWATRVASYLGRTALVVSAGVLFFWGMYLAIVFAGWQG
jgi:hypothetical protein